MLSKFGQKANMNRLNPNKIDPNQATQEMPTSYKIETRTPRQFGMRVWRPPYNLDATEMRARYIIPHLDELRAEFHPAGPYVSGQTEYSFAVSSQPRQRDGSDFDSLSPRQLLFPDSPVQLPAYHNVSDRPTASRTAYDYAHSQEVSFRREMIERVDFLARRREEQRRAQDQLQHHNEMRAKERHQAQEELLAQEQQRTQEYLQVQAQRQAQEQIQMQIQTLTDPEAIAALALIELRHAATNSPHDIEAIAARAACDAEATIELTDDFVAIASRAAYIAETFVDTSRQ